MYQTPLLIMLSSLLLAVALPAQEPRPPEGSERDTRRMEAPPPMRKNGAHRSFGGRGGGFQHDRGEGFNAWMNRIKEQDPEEYRRLQRLKEENPDALRQAMRERLQAERSRHILEQDARLRAIVEGLSEEDRTYLVRKLASLGYGPSARSSRPRGDHRKGEETIQQLAETARNAENPAKKQALTETLRKQLAAEHDRTAKERAAFLEKMSVRLEHLRTQINDHEARREELIEQRLEALLKGEAPTPRHH